MPHLLYPFICRWTLRLLPKEPKQPKGEVILKGENGGQSDQRQVGYGQHSGERECGTKAESWQGTEAGNKKHFKGGHNRI